MLRVAWHVLIVWLADTLSFLLLAQIVPGFDLGSWWAAIVLAAVLGLLNAVIRPVLLFLTMPFTVLTFGLLSLALNATMLAIASQIAPDVRFAGVGAVTVVVIGLAATSTFISGLLSLNDDDSFYYHVVTRLKRRGLTASETSTPGLVMLEIDGLAEPMLRRAIEQGDMPNVASMIGSGESLLLAWDSGLPSQTSASQAGILFGNSFDIPAFRWYEKDRQRLMISNRPATAAEIERRAASGPGLLHPDGSSIGNLVSGGAARSVMTLSALAASTSSMRRQSRDFYLYFLNPYNFGRAFVFMVREIAVELLQGLRARVRDERPRVGRGGSFPFLRAVSSVLLRELTTYLVIEDILAGTPAVYASYLGYDVVAHHAGPFGRDVRGPLREIDRAVGRIERVIQSSPRRYRLVLLSDHGQSQGATFRQRYGSSLDELVREFVAGAAVRLAGPVQDAEEWGYLNALLNELIPGNRPAGQVARRALGRRAPGEPIEVGPVSEAAAEDQAEIQVTFSGNLGLIYFLTTPHRMTLEEIESAYPTLVAGLATHPGIGLVLARSALHGPLAIGAGGIHHLANGRIAGHDPLAPFGASAARHLAALDSYPHCADLVVNSMVEPATGEVAAFEELIGSHGGLGGPQTMPFLLIPASWNVDSAGDTEIVGPDAVHHMLRHCMATLASQGVCEEKPLTQSRSAPSGRRPEPRPPAPAARSGAGRR